MATPEPVAFQDLPGVEISKLVMHADGRGELAELWRAETSGSLSGLPAVQANVSTSGIGVLRGMHLHRRQVDRWIVLGGVAFVALVDVRPSLSSPGTTPGVATAVMSKGDAVNIPEGVAHGFLALEPLELLYFVTNAYDGTDELGFSWDDPELGIPWPPVATDDSRPILSTRDAVNPPLRDLLARIRT